MLTLWNHFDRQMNNELRLMNNLFCEVAPRRGQLRSLGFPRVNLSETDEAFELEAEVPGFTAESLKLSFHEGVLTIEGKLDEANDEAEGESRRTLRRERKKLSFKRSFRFGSDVVDADLNAAVKDGILSVSIPKTPVGQPRTIAVTNG